MSESVSLPALGESVTEGTVTRWLKNVGDRVEVDEPLVEVSTDKVDTEIPSPIAGVIEAILVQEDETVAVGTPLVTIGDGSSGAGAATPAASPAAAEPLVAAAAPEVVAPEVVAPPAPAVVAPVAVAPVAVAPSAPVAAPVSAATTGSHASNSGYVTPIVRKLANDTGVNLSNVTGTGIGGRIRKEDILQASVAPSSSAPARARLAVSPLRGTVVPMTRLRKVVAERAVISMQSTAQLTTVVEVDVTGVANLRDSVKDRFFTATGV
ncbi:MAG: E3 binding domain-containing protein, partial [Actinomycetales bacterium]|nr:E3 binding domain-containing protein [Actinomycetales bacterium]